MKKLLIFLLIANIYLNAAPFSGGNGIAGDEYLIGSKEDIYALIDSINAETETKKYSDKHYKVIKNIRDSVRKCIPFFSGNWNGNGYKVTLAIENTDDYGYLLNSLTMFSWLLDNGVIKNVVIDGYVRATGIDHNVHGAGLVGAMGSNDSTAYMQVINCVNLCKVEVSDGGGIVGTLGISDKKYNNGIIERCINLGIINNTGAAGGITSSIWTFNNSLKTKIVSCINASFVKNICKHDDKLKKSWCRASGISARDRRNGILFNPYSVISNCLNVGVLEALYIEGIAFDKKP